MLSQHLITKPIFEALFSEYSFVNQNPVSQAMELIVSELEKAGFAKEQENLEPLYESVRMRAEGIEKAEDKQKIIVTLYDKFFKTAFKATTERLGIVFTPIEVVDFIVHSVDDVLKKHFGKAIESEGVHILDPFTGTGPFMVRTLHYLKEKVDNGEITLDELTRKYTQELHANEIVLLSYYIAAINIEATFSEINNQDYQPFEGIVLTDTFESTEQEDTLDDSFFGTNDERLKRQQAIPITVIMGNPPYSVGQHNEDNNQKRVIYEKLDESLQKKWVDTSTATNKNSLFDSYIRAIRWAADRILENGVIGFITNNSFIDGNAMDGMRKSLLEEFSDIYVLNLKGGIRGKTKEQSVLEGGNIFNIMTGVTIVLFIKIENNTEVGKLHYLDIGNSLNKHQKLKQLNEWKRMGGVEFQRITPNEKGDWINQRNSNFDKLVTLGDKKSGNALFIDYTGGVKSGRDDWTWGFSEKLVKSVMQKSIEYYNNNLGDITVYDEDVSDISWTRSLKIYFEKNETLHFDISRMYKGMYRPFVKKFFYYDPKWIDQQYQMKKIFPKNNSENILISVPNKTGSQKFTSIISNVITDVHLETSSTQSFPKYLYPKELNNSLFDNDEKYSSIRPELLKRLTNLSEKDVMYYIYGIFHSKEYANIYFDDLAKSFPKIPDVKHKEKYVSIGKELADLHLNYEDIPAYDGVTITFKSDNPSYIVKKMKHPKRGKLDTIIFNEDIVITDIPERAYEYVVNGKPAIEWIIDQYQVKKDKKSGIVDDPNNFSDDPKYILNLLLSVITVSMRTLELIDELPEFEFEE